MLRTVLCQVGLHAPSAHRPDGRCLTQPLDHVHMNASVGFSTQICTEYTTPYGGNVTTLYMTIQPTCRASANAPQRWRICSYQPDPLACTGGQQCCQYVGKYVQEWYTDIGDRSLLSCQDYYPGDCNRFYGWSGTHPQEYALELVDCFGDIPPDPFCPSFSGIDSGYSTSANQGIWWAAFAGGVGVGLLLIGAAIRSRRSRLARSSGGPTTPARPKHNFAEFVRKTTRDLDLHTSMSDYQLPLSPSRLATSKTHRDFIRLYEPLKDGTRIAPVTTPERESLLGNDKLGQRLADQSRSQCSGDNLSSI